VAEAIEDDIVTGKLKEGEPVYSQLILSRELGINPATAAKGINQLVGKGVLEKQRGLSMTVAYGTAQKLLDERRDKGLKVIVENLVNTAVKVGISKETVITEIIRQFDTIKGGDTDE